MQVWGGLNRAIALLALVLLSPVLGAIGVLIKLDSRGPVLYHGVRSSPNGTFSILKFRTMLSSPGPAITAENDRRITPVGRWLRRSKADELPQLWNVLRGDMMLVGPRPEDPQYVDWSNELHRTVYSAKPGMTGPAALQFQNEQQILLGAAQEIAQRSGRTQVTDGDIDAAYREVLQPLKLKIDLEYLSHRSVRGYLRWMADTIRRLIT